MTVGEMLERMDARELDAWMLYERVEPFGDRVTQMMVAQLTALVANVVRGKGGREVKVEDLMPRFEADKTQEMDWREMKRRMQMLTQAAKAAAKPTAGRKPAAGR